MHLFSLLETEGRKGNIKSLFRVLQTANSSVQKRKNIFDYMAAKAVTLPLILMTSLHFIPFTTTTYEIQNICLGLIFSVEAELKLSLLRKKMLCGTQVK